MNAAPETLPHIPAAPATTGNGTAADWRLQLAPSGSGFLGDERNILIALRHAPELIGLVRYNEFALQVEFTRAPPWRDIAAGTSFAEADDTELMIWMQRMDLKVRTPRAVADTVMVAARDHCVHPVRAYLQSLTWDQSARLTQWPLTYLNAVGSPEYLISVGARFLISAVARIMEPGCQADHMLVLEGPQGIGKTSAARTLAVQRSWFAGDLPEIHSKDARLQLVARWIVEIAELKAIRSTELESQKSFITQTHDTFRPPYGRRTAQFPRQCVFIATTNECEYLRDRTGNRRFWPIRCQRIDIPALLRDRDQLWAEAVHRYRAGEPWHLTDTEAQAAAQEQVQRVHVSELEHDVRQFLECQTTDEVTVRDVLIYALGLDPGKDSYAHTARSMGPAVAEALEHCGWFKTGREGKARRTTYRKRQG